MLNSVRLEEHIQNLLRLHDCVIIPNFGGLIANYDSAKINPTTNTFTPPSKAIVFNELLMVNDGLLAYELVKSFNISYKEAINSVNEIVEDWKEVLEEGKMLSLKGIGKFYLNREQNLQFEQTKVKDLNLDSFGLAEFSAPAIEREGIRKRIEKTITERPVIPINTRSQKYNYAKRAIAAAIAIPFLVGGVWWSIQMSSNVGTNTFGLSFWSSNETEVKEHVKEIHKKEEEKPVKVKTEDEKDKPKNNKESVKTIVNADDLLNAKEMAIVKEDTAALAMIEKREEEYAAKEAQLDALIEAAELEVKSVKVIKNFHIVAGCFSSEDNAILHVEQLKQKGFKASIVGKTGKGLFRVAYGSYETKLEGLKALAKVKVHENTSAWMLNQPVEMK